MYEYHGWISIKESLDISNYDRNSVEFILEKLSSSIDKFSKFPGICEIYFVNGNCHLSVGGFCNHSPEYEDSILRLYEKISEISRESYGLLHVRDDEDSVNYNNFLIYVLAKGAISKEIDSFLSPCIPKIEDMYLS